MTKKYRKNQFVTVKVTGIQPYGAFVRTPDNQEGLIHISEVMNDYVHNVSQYLAKGQTVKAKVLSVGPDGKLNLTLKENEYFKNEEKKKDKRSIIEQIKESEEYGFESLRQKMPQWIQEAKMRMQDK